MARYGEAQRVMDKFHTTSRIESRVARSSQSLLGCDISHARLLLNAHRHLLQFAQRHQLIATEAVARTETELDRLQAMLRP